MNRIRLIALDMDGTLLASDHPTVPQENIDAIRRADASGIRVCICTGRMLEDASDFALRLGLPCLLIACNGTRGSDGPAPGSEVWLRCNFEPQDALRVIDALMPCGLIVHALEDGRVSSIGTDASKPYHLVRRGLVEGCYGETVLRDAASRGIMKFFVTADGGSGRAEDARIDAARRALQEAVPHLILTSSAPGNIEIMPRGAGKGTALRALSARLGLAREAVMAMGDAPNDLSMLEYACHSVAMENASPEVKAVCRYQTGNNDAAGVAAMISRVLSAQNR